MGYSSHKAGVLIVGILLLTQLLGMQKAKAQNVTSPYSILGIGDIDTKDVGRYSVSGSTGISRRNAISYNFSNPASLTSLAPKVMNFELMGSGRISAFKSVGQDTLSAVSKDFVIRRITMAFRNSAKTAFAFGLRPYSSVNYKYELPNAVYSDGTAGYSKTIEGSGGINQVYGSFGYVLGENWSAGITASYLFGSTQKNTTYTDALLNLDITKEEYSFYSGASVLGGLQYYTRPGKRWQHTVGLTVSAGTSLKGYAKTDYVQADSIFLTQSDGKALFKMPVSAGLGYTATNRQGLSISLEADYYHWPYQVINYTNSYTAPSVRFAAGWEYAKQAQYTLTNTSYEKYYLGMGLNAQNSYFYLNGAKIWEYAVTMGGGYNLSGNLYLHTGLEFGLRGFSSAGQVQERYTRFTLGFTIKDIWFRSRLGGN
ncbi:hypothetical protein [Niabella ginsenosidivorans]|uniref:hypothetical protein n=1 Tax=Niabella ginsenosidivorans TaxID=1176587 RepID=UPI0012ECE0AA|nr:hypothetical protein [Niabella ginsenosidivorans]